MTLEISDSLNAEPGTLIGPTESQQLTVAFGSSDTPGAVRRYTPAANHRINAAARGHRVSMAHQNQEATSFARQESRRPLVVHEHGPPCERTCLSKPH